MTQASHSRLCSIDAKRLDSTAPATGTRTTSMCSMTTARSAAAFRSLKAIYRRKPRCNLSMSAICLIM